MRKVFKIKEKLTHSLNSAITEYVMIFCDKHNLQFIGWVGNKVGERVLLGDYVVDFRDIRIDLETDQKAEAFIKWYDYNLEEASTQKEDKTFINYESWIKGYRHG